MVGVNTVSTIGSILPALLRPNLRHVCTPPTSFYIIGIPRRAGPRTHHAQRGRLRTHRLCPGLPRIVSPTFLMAHILEYMNMLYIHTGWRT
jgi:hypothetical protein